MNTLTKFPFYAKASLLFIGLYVFISMLSIAQGIILPLLYATIFAILISPAVNFLVKKKINRTLSITGIMIFFLMIVALFVVLFVSQASRLNESLPQLIDKFQEMISQVVSWISGFFNISEQKINTWIADTKSDFLNNSSANISFTITTISDVLVNTLLVPVYIFMILYYQPHLIKFTHKIFGTGNDSKVNEILIETKSIIQGYLVGLFAEFVIVAILNATGLLILGIDYAILLGIIGALLNIIPYIGGIIAMALFMMIALVTKSPVYILYVSILYTFIQLIDNNYIVPKIIGAKVKLNALISIIAVIAGAALWGISGMFLSIPLIAIFKLIFDRIESLKPWGFLLGDSIPPLMKIKIKSAAASKK
ncbi:MAG TPA: AI-2E family transporter [Chitinophagaceae bacterium]|nr:AI-2E family transporter [Chitinophagaceae bacterium]